MFTRCAIITVTTHKQRDANCCNLNRIIVTDGITLTLSCYVMLSTQSTKCTRLTVTSDLEVMQRVETSQFLTFRSTARWCNAYSYNETGGVGRKLTRVQLCFSPLFYLLSLLPLSVFLQFWHYFLPPERPHKGSQSGLKKAVIFVIFETLRYKCSATYYRRIVGFQLRADNVKLFLHNVRLAAATFRNRWSPGNINMENKGGTSTVWVHQCPYEVTPLI